MIDSFPLSSTNSNDLSLPSASSMSSSSLRARSTATRTTTSASSATTMSSASESIHSITPATDATALSSSHSTAYGSTEDSSKKQSLTCTWDELPLWMRDNPAIWTGYRRPTFSYKKCIASLGYLHNESVNIWSHLLGAIVCIVGSPIAYFKIFGVLDTVHWSDIAVFYIFMAGAIICLSMSASFHTVSCHSEPVAHHWNRCDYVGIVFLIVGSFFPAIFYGFYCHKTWQIMYISLISAFGAATIVAVVRPEFRQPQYRWIRSCLFLAMGLSAVFPVIHALVIYGPALAQKAIALNYMACMGASYVVGALLYGTRTPERFFPGKLAHFGTSHQIFHIFVLVGCLTHFLGVTKAMAFWHDANHSCSIPIEQMRTAFLN